MRSSVSLRRPGAVLAVVLACAAAPAVGAELVMFEQGGCVWCRRFDAEIAPGYARSDEGRRAPLRRVDIHAQDQAGFTLASRVRITPTFVLVDEGRELGRVTGFPGRDFFWSEIAALTDRLAKSP